MDDEPGMRLLEQKWREYLERRGHRLNKRAPQPGTILFRNAKRKRYRWLLLIGDRHVRRLSGSEAAIVREHLWEARRKKEQCYLVVGFLREPRRIVVIPAAAALKSRCIRSDKGGIAWED
jgi:hypothetical protein